MIHTQIDMSLPRCFRYAGLYSNARTHTHTHLPCGGGQVVLLGGRLYSNARTHSVAVEDMVEAVKQGLPNALSSGSFSQPVVFFACRFLPPVNVQLSSYDLHQRNEPKHELARYECRSLSVCFTAHGVFASKQNMFSSGSFSQPAVFFACRFLPPVNVQ